MRKDKIHQKREFTNVRHLIEWAGEANGQRCAYSYREDPHHGEIIRVTFSQVRDDVRALASEMLAMGCAGKHCVLIGKMSYEWAITYFAALSIGAVLVPLDRDWLAEDLADTVRTADADFLLCDEDIAEKAEYIAQHVTLSAAPIYLGAKK